jgi:hypothetical protein
MVPNKEHTSNRILELRKRIDSNFANLNDYAEYEDILTKSGLYTHEEIMQHLNKYGYDGWKAFYNARKDIFNRAKPFGADGAAVGVVLGFGLALLLTLAVSGSRD